MATESKPAVKVENLLKSKKYESYVKSGDLYALPVTAVPGCGFILGLLLRRQGITRASELYNLYTKQRKAFPKYLACKFGAWNVVYATTIIRAFEDWEKINVVKPEPKAKKVVEEKKKGPPRKVGPGSKKWENFLHKTDLTKTSIMCVPGIASTLGGEMKKRGICTAQQLMDQYKGTKKGQCNGNDEQFHKWVLCCFGYWNTQYSKAVLAALKAYNEGLAGPNPIVQNAPVPVEPKQEPTEGNENQGESLIEKVSRVAESAAEAVGEALEQEREPKVSWAETLDQETPAGEIPAEESSSEDEGGE